MQKELKIYVDRLKSGEHEKIEETLEPHFLEINENEISFQKPIYVQGSAYLASDHLIIELKIKTSAHLPCIICNEIVEFPIQINNLRLTTPLSSIKAVFDYGPEVRAAILLKVPAFIECNNGNCPERQTISKYLK